jgi:hypothetical protein
VELSDSSGTARAYYKMAKRFSTQPGTGRAYAQPVVRKKVTKPIASVKYKRYLNDLGEIIKTRALEAKAERANEREGSPEFHFQCGRLVAFNEVISILQQQAEGFGIDFADLSLDDIDPDRDLV